MFIVPTVNAMFNDTMLDMIRESGEVPERMKRVFKKNAEFYQVFGFKDKDEVDFYIKAKGGTKFNSLMIKDPLRVDTILIVTAEVKRVFVAIHRVILVPGKEDVYVVDTDIVVAIDKEKSIPLIPVKDYKAILKDIAKETPSSIISRVRNYSR